MTKVKERQLMRLLHGELSPAAARALERELEGNAELRASYQRLVGVWQRLELPDVAAPAGLPASVLAAARRLRAAEPSGLAPAWARGGAAAALAVGVMLGAALGSGFAAPGAGAETVLIADAEADAAPLSLAEVYWLALEDDGSLVAGDDTEAQP